MATLIKEDFVNSTKGYSFGSSGWYIAFTDDTKKLFKRLQREYGKCTGKMYIDTKEGATKAVGYVFQKREAYTDCNETYLKETWVELDTLNEGDTIRNIYGDFVVNDIDEHHNEITVNDYIRLPLQGYNMSWRKVA